MGIDFNTDAVSAPLHCSNRGRPGPHEGIQYRVADKAKHPYESFCQFLRIRRGMISRGCPWHVAPDLLKPPLVVFAGNNRENPSCQRRTSVTTRFSLHKDELDIVLDHGVGLEGLSQKATSVLDFIGGVGNLVPNDRRKIVEANTAAVFLNRGVKGNDSVAPAILTS